jgi:outer membrane autotransporter protein
VLVQPAVGMRVASVAADGFAESGSGFVPAFAVRGAASSYDSVQPYVKLGLSHGFMTASGVSITPAVSIGYSYQLADTGRAVDVTAADGTHFRSGVAELGIDTVELSGGITASRGNWSVYARYRGYITLDSNDEIGEVGAAVRF